MEQWMSSGWSTILDDFSLPHIVVLVFAVIIIFSLTFTYYIQNRNFKITDKPKTFSLGMESLVNFIKSMVLESFGPRFVKLTPFFIFLFCFLMVLNIFEIFGIKEATTSYTVPLTLAFITWFTSLFYTIKYQKISFLKSLCFSVKIKGNSIPLMINPLNLLNKITPLISLSFRIWGNIIAGAIIYAVIYWFLGTISSSFPAIPIIIGGVCLIPMFTAYLSLFTGYIQAYVFTLLSITYISMPINEGIELEEIKKEKKLLKQQKKSTIVNSIEKE